MPIPARPKAHSSTDKLTAPFRTPANRDNSNVVALLQLTSETSEQCSRNEHCGSDFIPTYSQPAAFELPNRPIATRELTFVARRANPSGRGIVAYF